ncbi:MAG: DUF4070 domain-containing protein [Pseudomonadota bacterium]|nr:DUF4070 domain-containing protein [Pseudomonadota bacterium]
MPRKVRLLLINPRFPESFWSFRWTIENIFPDKRTINPPLGLATLAALCPPHWEVQIVDENVEPLPLSPEADLIGVCGMGTQFARQEELLRYYRGQDYYVVAGGSYASLCPDRYADIADTVVAGEAEYIWPVFCADFEEHAVRTLYRETGEVDLRHSPTPRYDLLKLDRYTTVSLQFSRGCPYRCEFCDIIVMFGRRPRTKPLEQVGAEMDVLRAQGVRSLFFVDDNLIGNKKVAKQLLRFLADYQARHQYRFSFGTEVSLNLAEDEDLLELFRAANFAWVFIGIESSDAESLRAIGKTQNARLDALGAVRTIYAHGIDVMAGFIVGFDNDTLDSFERQHQFIRASGIQVAMVGLLTALPRTRLHQRLQREGRLIPQAHQGDNTKLGTNFLPKRMGYQDMILSYKSLFRRLFSDREIAARIREKTRHLQRPAATGHHSAAERLRILGNLLVRGLLPGGPMRLLRFARTLHLARVHTWPLVITDWIAGLTMSDYVRRHFSEDSGRERSLVHQAAARLASLCPNAVQAGMLEISSRLRNDGADLQVVLRGHVEQIFYTRAARRMEKLLRGSAATLTLRIEAFGLEQRQQLEKLLERLAPYGQRISIWTSQRTRQLLPIDSSVFHLILDEAPAGAQ